MYFKQEQWWQKIIRIKYWQLCLILLFIIILFFITLAVVNDQTNKEKENIEKHELNSSKYISPLLDCADVSSLYEHELERKLNKIINKNIEDKKVSLVSLYYRDLNNGPWIGINENEEFSPASLLKVPLMITYLKIAEDKTGILQEKIKMNIQVSDVTQNINPQRKTQNNQEYTIDELIEFMIIYSDNNASNALIQYLDNLNNDHINKIYLDLGIEVPGENKLENFMRIKDYASFFRILYNSSYLNREMSEKALHLLSQSEFRQGLRANIPDYIYISHKFGERVLGDEKQLHDCGLIYQPSKPYLLCIMIRGEDFNSMSSVIQEISQTVYTETYFK